MDFELDFISFVILLGGAQGLFLSVLLFSRKIHRTANRVLSLLMAAYSFSIISIALGTTRFSLVFPHTIGITTSIPFLYGPLHFLYAKYLSTGTSNFIKQDLWHLLPFALYTVYLIPFFLESAAYKQTFYQAMLNDEEPLFLSIVGGLKAAHGLIYMVVTLRLLARNTKRYADHAPNLNWLRQITQITTGIWGLNAVLLIGSWVGFAPLGSVDMVIGIAVAVTMYVLGYIGLRQSNVFSDPASTRKTHQKYERSGLTPEQSDLYLKRLTHALENDHVYKQGDLTLNTLAETLDMSPNHLSQIMNERLNKNFFELINTYRVQAAQHLLLDPDYEQWTILALALEVGFNSKSAFNAAFKRHTQSTPTQYRKMHKYTS